MKVFNLKTMEIVELLQENTQKAKEKFPEITTTCDDINKWLDKNTKR